MKIWEMIYFRIFTFSCNNILLKLKKIRFLYENRFKTGFQSDKLGDKLGINIGSFTAFKKEFIASAIRLTIRVANGYRFI